MNAPLVLAAPAKLNLFLHVTGRRPDGYHDLCSLVAFLSLADRIEIAPAPDLALRLDGPFASALGKARDNIAMTAALRLAEAAGSGGEGHGAHIRITKAIPVAAGLGGGSADAGAVLAGLSRLWRLGDAPLHEVARGLGADVPVCVDSVPALVEGIGERLAPVAPLPPAAVVLANPGRALETRSVFEAYDSAGTAGSAERASPTGPFAEAGELAAALAATGNDLTDAARGLAPEIDDVLAALAREPGCLTARMAGSGATCFALFAAGDGAARAAARIGRTHPGWWTTHAVLVGDRDDPEIKL